MLPVPGAAGKVSASLDVLDRLELESTDEIIVIPTEGGRSPYFACNVGAERANRDWVLFLSHDVIPEGELLDLYFEDPVGERCGALVGGVNGSGVGITNLMVRASAHASAGGFHEEVRAAADVELSRRLDELGWEVAPRPGARVKPARTSALRSHPGREFRAGAGALWLGRRFRGSRFPRRPDFLLGALLGDNRQPNRPPLPRHDADSRALVVWTDAYPARSETFVYNEVEALRRLGWSVRVESAARPARVERSVARRERIDYLEDEPPFSSGLALIRLIARHPIRCLADRRARSRWTREEEVFPLRSIAAAAGRLMRGGERHVHVHFAAGAALNAMRACHIVGVPYTVVGHGYDVFERPRNLPEKLDRAKFAIAPCEYTARHLRRRMNSSDPGRVEVIVMGVDGQRFKRSGPYPGGRAVIGVGRLVEKKGFRYLVEAAARLEGPAALDRVTIVGDGPLREELHALAASLGVADVVEIVDAWGADAVAELLEQADLLAMPAVIAANGDRDAMPVVVKEAMAMAVPVVASDEVGLPELVHPEWGRLVAPADPDALAGAIGEVLDLPLAEREAMGARGRQHVLERCSIELETARLARLLGE